MDTKFGVREQTLNNVIYSVTTGQKKPGDYITAKNFGMGSQKSVIFKELMEAGIVRIGENNFYVLTEDCVENAQNLYFDKIIQQIGLIRQLAESANIPRDTLTEILKGEIKK